MNTCFDSSPLELIVFPSTWMSDVYVADEDPSVEPTTKSFVVGWIWLIESGHGYTNFEAIKRKHTNNTT